MPDSTASVLTSDLPGVDETLAQQLLLQHYGIAGKAIPLQGERDKNFCLQSSTGDEYMARFINSAELDQEIDFQTEMLRHIEDKAPQLKVPRVLCTPAGEYQPRVDIGDQEIALRVVSYLQGTPQYRLPPTEALMRDFGETLGQLDAALADFSHPGSRRQILWDLGQASYLIGKTESILDTDLKALVVEVLNYHRDEIKPREASLPWQVIHNDLNPHNVLVNEAGTRISGIIDFGDALYAPRINNLGTALAYQLVDEEDPLRLVHPFLEHYQRAMPLSADEIALLPALIATRLCLTITISSWRASLYPENRSYILRNVPTAAANLTRLRSTSQDKLREALFTTAFQGANNEY